MQCSALGASTKPAVRWSLFASAPWISKLRSRSFRLVIASALLLVAGISLYENRDWFVARRWGEVDPHLIYRSGQLTPWVLDDAIRNHTIAVIVDLNGVQLENGLQQAEMVMAQEMGVKHYRFPLRGNGTGDIRNYAAALQVLAESARQGKTVLVHCTAGAQRTGGVIALYRMLFEGVTPEKARDEMEDYGWRPGRDDTVLWYLNDQMDELTDILVSEQVLTAMPAVLPQLPIDRGS